MIVRVAIPQASIELLSTSAATIEALPVPSNCTVMSLQMAVGAILSKTVTIAVQVSEFPPGSVTVNVTVLVPILVQSKVFGVAVLIRILEQLS